MENYFDNIQDYLDGLLSEDGKRDFEAQMAADETLKKETLVQKKLNEVISSRMKAAKGLDAVKSTIAESSKKHFEPAAVKPENAASSRKIFTLRNWSIAVGIAACFLIGLSYFGVFSSNLSGLPVLQSEVVRGSDNQSATGEAIEAFNDKQYKKSIQLFSALIKENGEAVRFKYYLGLSYFGDKNWNKALAILRPIADGQSLYHEKAAYFTAMTAWKLSRNTVATAYAHKVSRQSDYYKKAQRLLRKME